ncbi:MAG: ASKHA domain-containing protein [Phycisphaerae bacterium]|jgi:uncharacterized 2Fe-2S/4Fe-4S cluster protein (DUF4445 family)|nr:ASKHA domain-containing protein [Phycisphaerae bacterium]
MAGNCKVSFLPDDKTVEVRIGTTILAAAGQAGVFVNSLCGGDGVCGRCGVIVRKGTVTGGTTEFFSHEEIQQGHILACEGRIESDIEVEIPEHTRLAGTPEYLEADVHQPPEVRKLAHRKMSLSPLVRKTYVQLPPPTLDDNQSDLQRLEHGLSGQFETQGFQMGLKVTRRLPEILRQADWKVTAMTGHRGPLTEIIDVEPGKTSRRNMCIAADIGTTTVVCHLVDLCDGQTLGKAGKYNSQIRYGGDIIRRIIHASESGSQDDLRKSIVGDLNDLIGQLVKKHRLSSKDISLISVAGNTTMVHLLAGLPVANIRKEPYIGVAYNLPAFRAAETGLQIHPRGLLYCLPCVAGFVGADTVAGIFASGMTRDDKVRMLIDIGTNGEIVVGNKDFLVCASASAGPAFEGGECSCGMRASSGAIDHIRLLDADNILSYSTISSGDPIGICGTGYIDAIAEMLRTGVIDKTGRISADASAARVRPRDDGELEYLLTDPEGNGDNPDVTITQEDINNIMRAKGAIYAAESVLLGALNMTFDDVAEVMVAGAFGNFLNVDNSVFIGLLPDVPSEKLRFVGNTSLAGAKLAALSDDCYEEIFRIAANTTYFELSTEPTFMDQFVSACFFPHTNLDLFPSVMSALSGKSE